MISLHRAPLSSSLSKSDSVSLRQRPSTQCGTHHNFAGCVQNAQARQVGSEHTQPSADGIFRPGRAVQIQHRQPRQGSQHVQLLDTKGLYLSTTDAVSLARVIASTYHPSFISCHDDPVVARCKLRPNYY